MTLWALHRRLVVGMGLTALLAYLAGAGPEPVPLLLGGGGLLLALVWRPGGRWGRRMEAAWKGAAIVLLGWLVAQGLVGSGDLLGPALTLLLLLLVGETLRPLRAGNEVRVYSLAFALLMASTAFRPGIEFAFAFVAFVGLAALALTVGHLARETDRHRIPPPRVSWRFLTTTAALAGGAVLLSGALFVTLPRLPGSWLGQERGPGGPVMAGFADEVSLGQHGSRIDDNPRVVLRIEFPGGDPPPTPEQYWRGRSYDRFDGVRWSRTLTLPGSGPPPRAYLARWGGRPEPQRIYGGPAGSDALFGRHPVVAVDPHSRMRPRTDAAGDLRYRGTGAPRYTVWSAAPRPPPGRLEAAGGWDLPARAYYLQLPALPVRMRALADSLTVGREGRLAKVQAVEEWLRATLGYTRELPSTPGEASLEGFLFDRREGHCEYFSTAMVVLLRLAGVPARNVTGFLGGEWNAVGQHLAVTQSRAHSWVEVWFPGAGWVPFDPTPPGDASAVAGGEFHARPFGALGALVDGLQHRWYRWVLEFDRDSQRDLFQGAARAARDLPSRLTWERAPAPSVLVPLLILLVVAGAGAFHRLRGRRGRRERIETRLFRRMKSHYVRAGYLAGGDRRPPLAVVAELRRVGAPAYEAARRFTELYLRTRFGVRPARRGHAELVSLLARVRGAVRASPRPGARS